MVISKADTDSKSILSECEMIQEKPSGLKEWFGRGNKREPKGTDRTGKTYGLHEMKSLGWPSGSGRKKDR